MRSYVMILMIMSALFMQSNAQEARIDTAAVVILDRMGRVIGDLESCGYQLSTSRDVMEVYALGYVKHFDEHEIFMVGPDKMLVNSRGDKGHQGVWYNGSQIAFYSYDENNYALIDAPSDIISMIDSVNHTFGVDFPAADFFYPTFTDDLIDNFDYLRFLGTSVVDGQNSFHIVAKNDEMSVQIWISDDAYLLPVKMVIAYLDETPTRYYEASFSDWQLNPVLPGVMFEFSPPLSAKQIRIVAK